MNRLIQIIRFIQKHPLAGRHVRRALLRFFGWQVVQTVFPHKRIVPLIGNTRVYMRKGLTGATGNYYTGLLEFSEMAFLLHFLQENDLFADVGANVGVYTLLASGYRGATTMAFEPVPSTFEWLQHNIALNRMEEKVFAYNMGVGSSAGVLHFSTAHDTVNHVVMEENADITIKVSVNTLAYFFKLHGVPLLMKVDVEGFETEVIKGLGQFVQDGRLKAMIIELNGSGGRYGYDDAAIHQFLLQAGFSPYVYEPFARQLQQVIEKGPHNTIYIRDFAFVAERIRTALPVKVFGESF